MLYVVTINGRRVCATRNRHTAVMDAQSRERAAVVSTLNADGRTIDRRIYR